MERSSRFFVESHLSRFGGTVYFVLDRAVEDPETGLPEWVGYAETRAEADARAAELNAAELNAGGAA